MLICNNLTTIFSKYQSIQFQQALPDLSSKNAKIAFVALAIISTLIAGFYLVKCYQNRKLSKTEPVVQDQNLKDATDLQANLPPKSPKKVAFNEVRAREFDKNEAPTDIEKISLVGKL